MDDQLQPSNTISNSPSESLKAKFSELFPGLLRDGTLDVEALADLLDVDVTGLRGGKEKFGLSWAGKKLAIEALQTPSLATLAPDLSNSIDFHSGQNVFIEGDNLEVLKLLQNAYNDQIRLIYIDPPYNTGSDFVYNDDFSDPIKHYMEVTGQADAEGNRLIANTETNGRKHSNWLTMMYPRLSLARNLLTQDGAIFVSIDDNEVHHLRLLMDEIFGPENFIGQFIWAAGRKNDARFISNSHEYIVCYARNYSSLATNIGEWRARKGGLDDIYRTYGELRKKLGADDAMVQIELRKWYASLPEDAPAKRHKHYNSVDSKGVFFASDVSAPDKPETRSHRALAHPVTGKPTAVPAKGWRWNDETLDRLVAEGRLLFGVDENRVPQYKGYLSEREYEAPYSVFYQDGRGSTKRLSEFLGGPYFDFPKDELVLQQIIEFATDKDSIVLDFFAGSGTTGHSVALQNEKDGGNRKYILVTIDEPTSKGSFARKQGIEKVSDITLMRLKKVAETITNAKDAGLKVLKLEESAFVRQSFILDDSNMLLADSTTKADQPHEKIAAEIALSTGKRLDEKWQEVKLGNASGIRVGKSFVVLEPGFDISVIDAAQVAGISEIYFLEDHFAGRDPIKSNLYFESKKQSITIKTF